jgi:hypothetical protein
MLKYLRIAVTALSVTACVLLIVLWVRSYWRFDTVEGDIGGHLVRLLTASGNLRFDVVNPRNTPPQWNWSTEVIKEKQSVGLNPLDRDGGRSFSCRLFNISTSPRRTYAWMPFLVPVLLAASLGVFPWAIAIRRFSLKALMILCTLVAVGLGVFLFVIRSQNSPDTEPAAPRVPESAPTTADDPFG